MLGDTQRLVSLFGSLTLFISLTAVQPISLLVGPIGVVGRSEGASPLLIEFHKNRLDTVPMTNGEFQMANDEGLSPSVPISG